jgi:hypothetical protein
MGNPISQIKVINLEKKISELENSFGLAPYGNTVQLKPSDIYNNLIISDLYIQGIDYLSVFCLGTKKRRSKRFKMRDLELSTRVYKKTYLVTDEKLNYKVGILNKVPGNQIINSDAVAFKFDNEILYQKFFNRKYIEVFLNSLGLKLISISRLDLYRDFQKFYKMMPGQLIRDFCQENILCKSRAKFCIIGVNDQWGLDFQYLRNGKKSSGRQFYLYNKSKELKEVANKEHIVKTWENAEFNKNIDVWRLELSLTKGRRNIEVSEVTGEILELGLENIFKRSVCERVYNAGLRSSFTFVERTNIRKTRCKKIKLFKGRGFNNKLVFGVYNVDKLRMRKIILRSLMCDIMNDKEIREHKTTDVRKKIDSVINYVMDYNLWYYYTKVTEELCKKYNLKVFRNNGFIDLVYKYYGKNYEM